METEEENLEKICTITDSSNYSLLELELDGELKGPVLIAMARFDFERTLPYIKKRLRNIPEITYEWKGHPLFYDPFILTMAVIMEDQVDRNSVQAAIDKFKPLTSNEKNFLDYTFRCLFYIEPSKKQNIIL